MALPGLASGAGPGLGAGADCTAWKTWAHVCAEDTAGVASGAGRVGCVLELSSARPVRPGWISPSCADL